MSFANENASSIWCVENLGRWTFLPMRETNLFGSSTPCERTNTPICINTQKQTKKRNPVLGEAITWLLILLNTSITVTSWLKRYQQVIIITGQGGERRAGQWERRQVHEGRRANTRERLPRLGQFHWATKRLGEKVSTVSSRTALTFDSRWQTATRLEHNFSLCYTSNIWLVSARIHIYLSNLATYFHRR